MSYQTGLESVEARLLVYKKNESVLEENIKLLNIELSPSKHEQDLPSTSSAPIIEDWVSDSEEEDIPQVSAVAHSKSQPVLTTVARTIRAVKPKFSKARPNITPYAVSKTKSPFRKPSIRPTSPKPSISPPRVNAANPSAVSAARVNVANPSAVSAARTPQQNGIAKRKNRTLIEAARTLLADLLLPIPFWAEADNTACYVQNMVLVTKPHNKTPYELLHCRLPSIGFMRPFGCSVTILNTLDPLGKFQGKETLHVNFMENKPNVAGSGLASLFDIDSLSQTMNYHPVLAENQTNSNAGFQDLEKAREEGTQTYVLFPVLSKGSTNPMNNKDGHTGGNEHNDDIRKSVSPDIHSLSCGDQAREQGDKSMNKDKGKNPVVTITGFRDLNEEFAECINNSSNEVSAAGPLVFATGLDFTNSTNDFTAAGPLVSAAGLDFTNSTNDFTAACPLVFAAGLNFTNSTNDFSAAGPSVSAAGLDFTNSTNDFTAACPLVFAAGLNFTNSTNDFSVASPSNSAMPNLEDLSHNADDVGAEADTNNMESIILVSPIPTTRIHKDHPTSQIIGDLSSTTQTRSIAKGVRDQGGIPQMFNEDFHTCMFACFLSQEEPKRIHQALKDPSWIEAMQEELFQFKMQKVWILVDLPYGKGQLVLNGFIETKMMKEA
nr:hypothetical protein [Tanacetum cinerariifolium]